MADLLTKLRGKLVVSCQPVNGGPMDRPEIIVAMALAAEAGGAGGVRIEGIANLEAVRPATKLPIIGLVKRDLDGSDVKITPFIADIIELAEAGADIIAYDATKRVRPASTSDLLRAIKSTTCLAMADCASGADAKLALAQGADILGTTLAGYAYELAADDAEPDLKMVGELATLGAFVMAEGRINSPADARAAIAAGADCVTVGSAITRIEIVTGWFTRAIGENDRN